MWTAVSWKSIHPSAPPCSKCRLSCSLYVTKLPPSLPPSCYSHSRLLPDNKHTSSMVVITCLAVFLSEHGLALEPGSKLISDHFYCLLCVLCLLWYAVDTSVAVSLRCFATESNPTALSLEGLRVLFSLQNSLCNRLPWCSEKLLVVGTVAAEEQSQSDSLSLRSFKAVCWSDGWELKGQSIEITA